MTVETNIRDNSTHGERAQCYWTLGMLLILYSTSYYAVHVAIVFSSLQYHQACIIVQFKGDSYDIIASLMFALVTL